MKLRLAAAICLTLFAFGCDDGETPPPPGKDAGSIPPDAGECPAAQRCGAKCCSTNETCDQATSQCKGPCTPACGTRKCGSDGCTGSCGTCAATETCSAAGLCESTDPCAGKTCSTTGESCDSKDGECRCTVGGTGCGAGFTCNATSRKCEAVDLCQGVTCRMTGESCDAADGKCRCAVGGAACAAGFTCKAASLRCELEVDICQGVTCSRPGESCDAADGQCRCTVGGTACAAGWTCNATTRRCTAPANACQGVTCAAEGEACDAADGECHCTVGGTACAAGLQCNPATRRCVADFCAGVTCPRQGESCDAADGACKCTVGGTACSAGWTCNAATRRCEPPSLCTGVTCAVAGESCDAADGVCRCTVGGAACPAGQTCSATTGKCTANSVTCGTATCKPGQVCADPKGGTGTKKCTCLPGDVGTTITEDTCYGIGQICDYDYDTEAVASCRTPEEYEPCLPGAGSCAGAGITCELFTDPEGDFSACARLCAAAADCPDLYTTCVTLAGKKTCQENICADAETNGAGDRAKYFQPCDAAGTADGTCLPLQAVNAAGDAFIDLGFCMQGGSATGACDAAADRSTLAAACGSGKYCDWIYDDATGSHGTCRAPCDVKKLTSCAGVCEDYLWDAANESFDQMVARTGVCYDACNIFDAAGCPNADPAGNAQTCYPEDLDGSGACQPIGPGAPGVGADCDGEFLADDDFRMSCGKNLICNMSGQCASWCDASATNPTCTPAGTACEGWDTTGKLGSCE